VLMTACLAYGFMLPTQILQNAPLNSLEISLSEITIWTVNENKNSFITQSFSDRQKWNGHVCNTTK